MITILVPVLMDDPEDCRSYRMVQTRWMTPRARACVCAAADGDGRHWRAS